jgi:hypothetical protein
VIPSVTRGRVKGRIRVVTEPRRAHGRLTGVRKGPGRKTPSRPSFSILSIHARTCSASAPPVFSTSKAISLRRSAKATTESGARPPAAAVFFASGRAAHMEIESFGRKIRRRRGRGRRARRRKGTLVMTS